MRTSARRPAGGAATAQGLGEGGDAGEPFPESLGDDGLHPALDQREQRLETFECLLLLGRGLRLEGALLQDLLDLRRVGQRGRVEALCGLLDRGEVHLDAARVVLDGGEQTLPQPRHVRVEALVGGLAGGDEDEHLAVRLLETLAERLDRGG